MHEIRLLGLFRLLKQKRVFVPLAVGLVLLSGLIWLFEPQVGAALRIFLPSCTFGVTGTAAQVTIQAWSAPLDCQALTNPNTIETFLGKSSPNAAHVSTYPVTQGTSGAIMCEVDYKGRHLVVRESSAHSPLKAGRSVICSRN